jgi:ParB family transcriptional regulator, chromosome partitioning protein
LADEVVEMIDSGALTKGHGKVLLTEPDHHRRLLLARQATERRWSVRTLESEIARGLTSPTHRPSPDPDQCAVATRLAEAITRAIGSEATAKPHRNGFQILLDHPAADRLARALGADMGAL